MTDSTDPAAPAPAAKPLCAFTECGRPATTKGLCHAHTMQRYRRGDGALSPLRSGPPRVTIPGLRLSREAIDALAAQGPSVYSAARAVIESWAKSNQQQGGTP